MEKYVPWIKVSLILSLAVSVSLAQNAGCGPNMFQCDNKQCIATDLACDGVANCEDGSDETLKSCGNIQCPHFSYKCAYGACVNGGARCNNQKECADNSDESGCLGQTPQNGTCEKDMEPCDSGDCIKSENICDGKKDCPDGSDETMKRCSKFSCPEFAFRCGYGGCINLSYKCNGRKDCADGSDEVCENPSVVTETNTPAVIYTYRSCLIENVPNLLFSSYGKNDIIPPDTFVKHNQRISYKCQDNYVISSNNGNTCLNGAWSNSHPVCTIRPIEPPSENCKVKIPGNLIITSPATQYRFGPNEYVRSGELVKYSCPKRHVLKGAGENYCINGAFVYPIPNCLRNCSSTILNGVTFKATCIHKNLAVPCEDPILPTTRANINCQIGYKRPDRIVNDVLVCDENGDWDYHPFSCEPECGTEYVEPKPFVAGGDITDITRVPWHVAIYEQAPGGQYKHICGGTIINAKVVLSAAHCFWDHRTESSRKKEMYKVVAGKYYRSYTADEPYITQIFNVAELHIPTTYKDTIQSYQNDIAILALNNFIQFRKHIKPICRIFESYENFNLPAGTKGRVAGWGLTVAGEAESFSSELKSVELPTISYDECQRTVPKQYKEYVTGEKFCVDSPDGETVCEGDSGGGFVIPKTIGGFTVYFLWGILSVSLAEQKDSCKPGHYTSFTNIQYHRSMIESFETQYRPK